MNQVYSSSVSWSLLRSWMPALSFSKNSVLNESDRVRLMNLYETEASG